MHRLEKFDNSIPSDIVYLGEPGSDFRHMHPIRKKICNPFSKFNQLTFQHSRFIYQSKNNSNVCEIKTGFLKKFSTCLCLTLSIYHFVKFCIKFSLFMTAFVQNLIWMHQSKNHFRITSCHQTTCLPPNNSFIKLSIILF